MVELLDTNDPVSAKKYLTRNMVKSFNFSWFWFYRKVKLDPDLDAVSGELLDTAAARHKLSVKPRRRHASSRHSPTRLNINSRYN